MNIETEALISLLKLSREGPVSHETLKQDVKAPSSTIEYLLQKLQNDGLVNVHKNRIETDAMKRLRLAVMAVQSGADLERVGTLLHWKEFEAMAAYGFEQNGYRTFKNVRLKHDGRRYEIDVAAYRSQLVVCADCKHWRRGLSGSVLSKVIEEQVERTQALSEALPNPKIKISLLLKRKMTFIPMIFTLIPVRFKVYNHVPIVSILQSQDFLNELPTQMQGLKHFQRTERFKTLG